MVFVRGVGAVDARSAVRGPLSFDGLAETSDRGFIWEDVSLNNVFI